MQRNCQHCTASFSYSFGSAAKGARHLFLDDAARRPRRCRSKSTTAQRTHQFAVLVGGTHCDAQAIAAESHTVAVSHYDALPHQIVVDGIGIGHARQQEVGITFIYVTHDQEEALSMSDTVVVMNNGEIQQIGSPTDIYNEPENRFVAGFIGESNIIEGTMIRDYLVAFDGFEFECVDKGFEDNEEIEVVLRPEDLDIVDPGQAKIRGIVRNITFKGVHYEILIETELRTYMVHTTDYAEVGREVGLKFGPEDIHVMCKMGSY